MHFIVTARPSGSCACEPGGLDVEAIDATPVGGSCPSCELDTNKKIVGTLAASEDFSSTRFPITSLTAVIKSGSTTKAEETIAIGSGTQQTEIEHLVAYSGTYDAVYLRTVDKDNVTYTTADSIPIR